MQYFENYPQQNADNILYLLNANLKQPYFVLNKSKSCEIFLADISIRQISERSSKPRKNRDQL